MFSQTACSGRPEISGVWKAREVFLEGREGEKCFVRSGPIMLTERCVLGWCDPVGRGFLWVENSGDGEGEAELVGVLGEYGFCS